jgi:hypothetical protein
VIYSFLFADSTSGAYWFNFFSTNIAEWWQLRQLPDDIEFYFLKCNTVFSSTNI